LARGNTFESSLVFPHVIITHTSVGIVFHRQGYQSVFWRQEVMERQVYWDERDVMNRLRRIEGQVRGLQQLVANKESCRAILTQVAAVEGALQQVSRIVETCSVAEALLEDEAIGPIDANVVRGTLKRVIRGK
jgi:DNA-binding FrmR family transcriptional regulator